MRSVRSSVRLSVWACVVCVVMCMVAGGAVAYNNGVGRTPVMGFNSWNHYAMHVNETIMMATADALIATGLAGKGYVYVDVDDGWAWTRDPNGTVTADPHTFPKGMAYLADYMHDRGLKFGLYTDLGNKTCGGRPGTLGFETIDAETYAAWQIDLIKVDHCHANGESPKVLYPAFGKALNASGRAIVYAMCEWGVDDPALWAPPIAQSWRISQDIKDVFVSVVHNLDQSNRWWRQAGPFGFNMADILEVGNGGLTAHEEQAHFALWALIKSPLLIGCSVVDMEPDVLKLLGNTALIGWNQDSLGVQGHLVASYLDPGAQRDGALSLDDVVLAPCVSSGMALSEYSTARAEAQSWVRGSVGTGAAGAALPGWVYEAHTGVLKSTTEANVCAGRGPASGALVPVPCSAAEALAFTVEPEAGALVADDGTCATLRGLTFDLQVWAGPLSGSRVAVVLFNRGILPRKITAHWSDIGLKDGDAMRVTDVIAGVDHGVATASFEASVPAHGCIAVQLDPASAS